MMLVKNRIDLSLTILVNFIITIFFICINPFYVLALSSIINVFSNRINPNLFTFLFSLSFSLLFFNKFPGASGDGFYYLLRYIENFGFIERGSPVSNEPLWTIYEILTSFILRGHEDLFILLTYFLLFLLVVILSRVINKEKFIIISFCLLLFNLQLLYGVYQIWRTYFAILLFFIGAYSIRASLLIYLTPLIHVMTLPFVIIISKINYKYFLLFTLIAISLLPYILDKFNDYQGSSISSQGLNLNFVIFAYLIGIVKILKLIKFSHIENRIFYVFLFLIFLPLFIDLTDAFHILYSRSFSLFLLFTSIIVARVVISHQLFSYGFIFIYSIYRFMFSFNDPRIIHSLGSIGDGNPMYTYNGIWFLLENFNLNRYSDFIIQYSECISGILIFNRCRDLWIHVIN